MAKSTFYIVAVGLTVVVSIIALAGCSTNTRSNSPPAVEELASKALQGGAKSATSSNQRTVSFDSATNLALAMNPAGDKLVLSIQGTLFELPADGGKARALTDYYQDAREPSFSPDGSQVTYHGYAGGTWDIYQLHLKSGNINPLTDSPFDDREPVFSPDGSRLAFSSDRSGNYDLWELTLATGDLRQLTTSAQDDYSPSYSAAGDKLFYARHIQRDESQLRVLDLSTRPAADRLIAGEPGVISGVSAASTAAYPEQSQTAHLAYQLLRRDRVGRAHTELKVATSPSKGAGTTRVLSPPGADVFPFRAAWAPQTSVGKLELIAAVDGKLKSYPLQARGLRLTDTTADIEFSASFTLNRQPYERRQRSYDDKSKQALGIVAPALSHAGGRVAFTALGDLWQWNFVSDELQQLTDDVFAEATPSYSPDGTYIAYVSDKGGTAQLWLHNLSDGTQRILDRKVTGVSYPSWSPDGNRLAYFGALANNPLGGQLMLADLRTGSSQSIGVPTSPQPLSWSADGDHLAAAVLAPYSRRYREGVYDLLVFSTRGAAAGKEVARLKLQPHLSPFSVRLTPDGKGVGYVQAGQLFYQPIDPQFNKVGDPRRIGNALADSPAWSGNGKEVLAVSGDRVRRFNVASGEQLAAMPVPLDYSRRQTQGRWTLRTSRLFDGEQGDYQENLDIVINNNRIEAVVARSASSPEPVVDVSAYTVIPGMFEMHAHMGVPSEPQGRTWLSYGITSVRDPGSDPYLSKERQEVWDSGRRPGPRTHITGYLTDGNRVFYPIAESLDADSLEFALQRTRALKLDFIKTYVRLPDDAQRRVVRFAHEMGIPTSSHELFPAAAHGMDHVEHIGGTSRRGYQPKVSSLGYSYADVVELLSVSNMGITATAVLPAWAVIFSEDKDLFATSQFNTFYGPSALKGYAGLAQRFGQGAKTYHQANSKLLRELVARDALLVTGTDAPFVPYGTGLHAELRLYERAGLKPWQVLRAATAKAAEAAGVGKELGRIKPGWLADLVVIDGDPLATTKDADNVVLTIKGGRQYPLEELLTSPVVSAQP